MTTLGYGVAASVTNKEFLWTQDTSVQLYSTKGSALGVATLLLDQRRYHHHSKNVC